MKVTITQTFTATKTTCGRLVKEGQTEGRFMEPSDTKPLFVWQEYSWIQANPRKVIYLLSDEETTVAFQAKCGGTCCGGDYKCVCDPMFDALDEIKRDAERYRRLRSCSVQESKGMLRWTGGVPWLRAEEDLDRWVDASMAPQATQEPLL